MVVAKKLKRVVVTSVTSEDRKLIAKCKETEDINEIILLTRSESAAVRVAALREMCPCHLQEGVPAFWVRVLEMVGDEDLAVRKQVLHTLCDGSPASLQVEVMEAMEKFNHDTDTDLRRMAHKVIGSYHRTGKLNIL